METKTCSICKIEKDKSNFHKRSERSSGVASACKECRQPKSRQYYEENKDNKILASCKYQKENSERVLKNRRKWILINPDAVKRNSTNWRKNNPQKVRSSILKARYNLSLADYQELLLQQGGVCAICHRVPNTNKNLVVDHDHITNQIRGLLCNSCNLALGLLKDNKETIKSALNYLGSK